MDFLTELENMAINIGSDAAHDLQLSDSVITRWQQLFRYTRADAISRIENHRSDISRRRVSDEHWDMVHCAKEADGYDREAYEHEVELGRTKPSRACGAVPTGASVSQASSRSTYILKLEGPLDTAAKVQEAANLEVIPTITTGIGELGEVGFVTIDTTAKDAITVWLSKQLTPFTPTLVRVSRSGKDLSEHSMHPTLGVDTTLPQYRADTADTMFLPTQNQYPVWYFFYGNLAVPDILTQCLALLEEPAFKPATIVSGVIRKWRGKYNALLDLASVTGGKPVPSYRVDALAMPPGKEHARVDGWAYLVETEEHEEALRLYETDNYEIVRCAISMKGRPDTVKGLTFKFVGPSGELT